MQPEKKIVIRTTISKGPISSSDFLSDSSGLSKMKIKDAMNKGAAWIRRGGLGPMLRLRKASLPLKTGDFVEFYYDREILSLVPPAAECLSDRRHYTVWFKPAGLLSQGTKYGDHCSLTRQAELFFSHSRKIFVVHRLDREVSGLIILAHSPRAAARLSEVFRKNLIIKKYRLEVLGDILQRGRDGSIDIPLDGKPSHTEYHMLSFNPETGTSLIEATIATGRLHQIRRHFNAIGFPVMGDPKYGEGNKNKEGIKLSAVSLKFICPFEKKEVEFSSAVKTSSLS